MSDFEQFAVQYGGIATFENYEQMQATWYRARLVTMREHAGRWCSAILANNGKQVSITPGYIANDAFRARVRKCGNAYFIGLNVGIHVRLRQVFCALLSHPSTFPHLQRHDGEPVFGWPESVLLNSNIGQFPPVPAPSPRTGMAFMLASIAEMFIFEHELTHILHGHLDFLNVNYAMEAVDEDPIPLAAGPTALEWQTLEWDADCAAVKSVLEGFLDAAPRKSGEKTLIAVRDNTPLGSLEESVKTLSFAMFVATKFFERPGGPQGEDAHQIKHPSAAFRTRTMIDMVVTVLSYGAGRGFRSAIEWSAAGVVQAAEAWCSVFGVKPALPIGPEFEEIHQQLVDAYSKTWTDLHPQLDAVKLLGRLPPAVNNERPPIDEVLFAGMVFRPALGEPRRIVRVEGNTATYQIEQDAPSLPVDIDVFEFLRWAGNNAAWLDD